MQYDLRNAVECLQENVGVTRAGDLILSSGTPYHMMDESRIRSIVDAAISGGGARVIGLRKAIVLLVGRGRLSQAEATPTAWRALIKVCLELDVHTLVHSSTYTFA